MRKEKGKRDLGKKETEIRYNFIFGVYLEEQCCRQIFFTGFFVLSHIEPTSAIQQQQHTHTTKQNKKMEKGRESVNYLLIF